MKDAYQGYGLPEWLTLAYRLVPEGVRRFWSMRSSSSADALAAIRDSHRGASHWAAFRMHIRGVVLLPGYTVGAGLRHAGVSELYQKSPLPKGWEIKGSLGLFPATMTGLSNGLRHEGK